MILKLDLVEGEYAIVRLSPDSTLPDWASGHLVSVTWTPTQCSVICEASVVPESEEADRNWRCLKVHGNLGFSAVGTVDSIAQPLRAARISIFVVSTFDTDYIFVHSNHFNEACRVLRAAGHIV
ncbi:MAG: ACT domain-containing protein [Rhodothermales bacterium]|nr:ACT domain-containing protein [Rhodothermales bacterium]